MFDSNGTVSEVFPGFVDDFNAIADFFVHVGVYGFSNDFNPFVVVRWSTTWSCVKKLD